MTDIPAASVDSVWVRGGSASTGALIGGAVGGIGLGATAAGFSGLQEGGSGDAAGAFVGGFAVGALGGAVIGALIGSAVPSWHLLRPEQPRQPLCPAAVDPDRPGRACRT